MLDNQILLPSYLSTSLRQKIEKSVSVYMCLRLCYPFPGKVIIRIV
jgi:hypothetical protein